MSNVVGQTPRSYLLEYEDLRSNLPPSQFPAAEYVDHVVPHSIHEEEVPPFESLLEDGHLTKATTRASTGEEHSCWSFSLDKHVRAHSDATAELSRYVAKKPVFRYTKTRVFVESLYEELSVP
jgi:hypothetical protein